MISSRKAKEHAAVVADVAVEAAEPVVVVAAEVPRLKVADELLEAEVQVVVVVPDEAEEPVEVAEVETPMETGATICMMDPDEEA